MPTAIRDVIAVDNAPVDAILSSDFARYVRAMQRIDAAGVKSQRDADALLADAEPSLPIRQFLLANLTTTQPGDDEAAAGRREVGAKRFRVPVDILGAALAHMGDFPFKEPGGRVRFERPALFVRGLRSRYVPDEVLPVVGEFFPRFEVVDVDAGHWVISEKPEEFRQGEFSCFLWGGVVVGEFADFTDICVAVVKFLGPKE